ncbi:MAG: hypothetical protein ACE5FH_00700 [Candidatus Zixiibacteriota bacterium]
MIPRSIVASRWTEPVVVGLLLLLALILRLYNLDADPPLGLSISSAVYTDPAQYTLFGKHFVQLGDWNPFNDYRLVFFWKSTVTIASIVLFKLLGTSLWSSNLVGLLFSFGSLILFFLFVRKAGGRLAGVLFVALIALNYNHIFYGRLPFLEHSMAFWSMLALVVISYRRSVLSFALAGSSLAVGIFLGKLIGLVFLFPFFCLLAHEYFFGGTRRKLRFPAAFFSGFTTTAVGWYILAYLPVKAQVEAYVGEQAFSLYGSPVALESVHDFLWKLVSFGVETKLFPRMPVVSVLATGLALLVLYHIARRQFWRDGFGRLSGGHLFIVAMIVAFFGSLMIWNYRPLRYSMVLVYPIYGAAAIVLSMMWRRVGSVITARTPLLFYPLAYIPILVVVWQLFSGMGDSLDTVFDFDDYDIQVLAAAALLTAAAGLSPLLFTRKKITIPVSLSRVAVIIIIAAVTYIGIDDYYYWWQRPTFTARDNSADLSRILGPGAVVSGPYAPSLTLENNIPAVIHMFGVTNPDPDLFTRFPITHLLLDTGNESRAEEDYPEVMDSAKLVSTYHVGLKKIRLIRVAGWTENPIADAYTPTMYERAADLMGSDSGAFGRALGAQFLERNRDCFYAYSMMGEFTVQDSLYQLAEQMFKKAVELSPTNYNLVSRLAKFYKIRYEETGEEEFRQSGLKFFEQATHIAPTVGKLKDAHLQLLEGEQ